MGALPVCFEIKILHFAAFVEDEQRMIVYSLAVMNEPVGICASRSLIACPRSDAFFCAFLRDAKL